MARRKRRGSIIELDSSTGKVLSGAQSNPLTKGDKRVKSIKISTRGKRVSALRHLKGYKRRTRIKYTRHSPKIQIRYRHQGRGRRAPASPAQLAIQRAFAIRAKGRGKIRSGTKLLHGELGGKLYNLVPNEKHREGVSRYTINAMRKARAGGASDESLRRGIASFARGIRHKRNIGDLSMRRRHGRMHGFGDTGLMESLGEPLGIAETAKEVFSGDNLKQIAWLGAGAVAPEVLRRQVIDRVLPQISQTARGQVGNAVDFGVALLAGLVLENFRIISTQNAITFINGAAAATVVKAVKSTGVLGNASLSNAIADVIGTLPSSSNDSDSEAGENVGTLTEDNGPNQLYFQEDELASDWD